MTIILNTWASFTYFLFIFNTNSLIKAGKGGLKATQESWSITSVPAYNSYLQKKKKKKNFSFLTHRKTLQIST